VTATADIDGPVVGHQIICTEIGWDGLTTQHIEQA